MDGSRPPPTSSRLDEAFALAHALHRAQVRKSTAIPYLSHLLAVASLVLEAGGDEDLAIAALLHDAVEDQGGLETLARIQATFGDRVAAIVRSCTDSEVEPKPPWRARKEAYLAHLREASPDARVVSAADKLHNARCILVDHRALGGEVWRRFTASPREIAWYYEGLAAALGEGPAAGDPRVERLLAELRPTVAELARAAREAE